MAVSDTNRVVSLAHQNTKMNFTMKLLEYCNKIKLWELNMTWIKLKSDWKCFYRYLALADIRAESMSIQNMSKFFPEWNYPCLQGTTDNICISCQSQTHTCLVEVYIRLITRLCFFKIGIKKHTCDCLSSEARLEPLSTSRGW